MLINQTTFNSFIMCLLHAGKAITLYYSLFTHQEVK